MNKCGAERVMKRVHDREPDCDYGIIVLHLDSTYACHLFGKLNLVALPLVRLFDTFERIKKKQVQ